MIGFPQRHPILAGLMVAVVGLAFIALVDIVLVAWWMECAP